jgi:hypothetical protein
MNAVLFRLCRIRICCCRPANNSETFSVVRICPRLQWRERCWSPSLYYDLALLEGWSFTSRLARDIQVGCYYTRKRDGVSWVVQSTIARYSSLPFVFVIYVSTAGRISWLVDPRGRCYGHDLGPCYPSWSFPILCVALRYSVACRPAAPNRTLATSARLPTSWSRTAKDSIKDADRLLSGEPTDHSFRERFCFLKNWTMK